MKLNKIGEVATVRIHFLSDVLICCHPKILLPTASPLYSLISLTVVNTMCYSFTLLRPESDQHQLSPNNILTSSRENVIRINKMITGEKND